MCGTNWCGSRCHSASSNRWACSWLSQAINTRLPERQRSAATAQATASWALSAPAGSACSIK
ncbi:hypothetical protein CR62_14680 [Serratia grimesii]|uniref:Uncharacterized protein n=1 Tax=Serratia grimesii TaxID=82995 RepID=A0ABR4U6N2_9GAMM|nr:hypothetical protein CR62_14680 [Serratia grimesii]